MNCVCTSADRCPVARPPRSCLRSGPTRGTRVTFSWDSRLCEEEEEEDPDLNDAAQHSQEVGVSADRPQGHTWSDTWSLQSGGSVGVSELSVVLGGLLQLVEQHWNGPGSLRRHQQFLSGSYDLLSELLQPAGGRGPPAKGTSQSCELVLLRRKLERTELQLERMKSRLLLALKENYQLRRSLQLTSEQQTHRDDVT
uniref:leucine-rich repeat-containing protein 36-like isoform X3 n=1 Tax=Scatophagus argus TaxID=75038 RepID=UPI001ED85E1A|nr:leucine-rich repeat-containing protein 36-like isoform X3 [Scatophagus argus]